MAVLMVAQIFSLLSYPAGQVLVGVGRMRALGVLSITEAVLNLTLTVTLVLQIGVLGAALGTLITRTLLTPLRLPLACRATGIGVPALVARAILPALLASAPAVASMALIWAVMAPGSQRLAVGLTAGVLAAASTAAAQIGVSRARAALAILVARGDHAAAV